MPAERYYYQGKLQEGELIELEGQEVHHLLHVMRAEVGDEIELVNGQGSLAIGSLQEIRKKQKVSIQILQNKDFVRPKCETILVQAMPRSSRLDTILEKGTELGMTQIWLFPGQRSERHEMGEKQIERMRSVVIAAMKQCGRLFLPEIVVKPPLAKWKECDVPAFFGDLGEGVPRLYDLKDRLKGMNSVLFFVGPESGFSEPEVQVLKGFGVEGVNLHENVLRTDTASLVALSLLSQRSV